MTDFAFPTNFLEQPSHSCGDHHFRLNSEFIKTDHFCKSFSSSNWEIDALAFSNTKQDWFGEMPAPSPCDLNQILLDQGPLEEEIACELVYTVVEELQYLHSRGIAHPAIRPENILVSMDWQVRLGERESGKEGSGYFAPEMHLKQPCDQSVDMWALGVTIFEMLSGTMPWEPGDVEGIVFGDYYFGGKVWDGISTEAKDLIACLLVVNPTERLTAEEALQHPWFTAMLPSENRQRWARGSADEGMWRSWSTGMSGSDSRLGWGNNTAEEELQYPWFTAMSSSDSKRGWENDERLYSTLTEMDHRAS
jgi:serine/threonine protein kinase